jgi:hypothetical protein
LIALRNASRILATKQASWEGGTICHEILVPGVHAYATYLLAGLEAHLYSPVNCDALSARTSHTMLSQVVVGLLNWDPVQ